MLDSEGDKAGASLDLCSGQGRAGPGGGQGGVGTVENKKYVCVHVLKRANYTLCCCDGVG